SLPYPDRWRALIGDVRRVYGGLITYGANWDREADQLPFWDACDVVGVSLYNPLAARSGASPAELESAARRALAGLHTLAQRCGRPVLLTEAGYPATAGAAVRPWEEARAAPPDPEAQRACYQALMNALDTEDWVAGVFIWKWPSGGEPSGPEDGSYTPRGKPAEQVLARAYQGWRDRPVRTPSSGRPARR
ncbi:MAG: glycoside hydrolase family 113, partial [Candidatus Eiseniibacteriota bacterium]